MKNNLIEIKNKFRKKQFTKRKKLFSNVKNNFNKYLFDNFFKKINFESIKVISSFISINTEINTADLNTYILKKKKILCLPVILKKDSPLLFRKFNNNDNMIEGFMKIKEPSNTSEIVIPDLLFVPCLAYDLFGFRLGYGGGYYDRTFNYLKNNNKKFVSVGYAFDDQKVSEVPKDKFDIKLDYVITEKKLYSFI
tara:strand:+ start:25 stop:609 length:585 start_codon:yes stop_codon:yes gene_type:complete